MTVAIWKRFWSVRLLPEISHTKWHLRWDSDLLRCDVGLLYWVGADAHRTDYAENSADTEHDKFTNANGVWFGRSVSSCLHQWPVIALLPVTIKTTVLVPSSQVSSGACICTMWPGAGHSSARIEITCDIVIVTVISSSLCYQFTNELCHRDRDFFFVLPILK